MGSDNQIKEFIVELAGFAKVAETNLNELEKDNQSKAQLFHSFSEQMLAIRGTAQQLNFPEVASIAGLGEEIAVKGALTESPNMVRKSVSALWDAVTTVKYLLEHLDEKTTEERTILVRRMENTLRLLGGPRPTATQDDIEAMLNKAKK